MRDNVSYSDKDEEVDLVNLFKKGWSLFKRRQKLFWAFIISGLIFALVYYNLKPPTYKSRMIISSTVFQGASFVIILDNLQMLLKDNNYEELASALGIDQKIAEKISKIEVYSSDNYAEREFGDKITFNKDKTLSAEEKKEKKEEFVIEAFVADNSVFNALEKGILYYLNNNPSIKENAKLKKQALNKMKSNILEQRIGLDSLKHSIAGMFNKKDNPSNLFIGDPGAMYLHMIYLYESEISAQEGLSASNINVIESFRLYKKQYSPKLGMSLGVFTLISLFLFMVAVISLEVNRKKETA